jgi:Concanavalin A-like lectin/glucanases superfamily
VAAPTTYLGVAVEFPLNSAHGIAIPDQAALDLTGDFTYEAWVRPDVVNIYQCILSKGQDTVGANAGYHFRISNTGKLELIKENISLLVTGTATLTAANWWHVAVTRAGNLYTCYVNGVAGGTATIATVINATNKAMQVGRGTNDNGTFGSPYDGRIDEVAVYGTALSAARLLAHYDARDDADPPPGDPVVYAEGGGVWIR